MMNVIFEKLENSGISVADLLDNIGGRTEMVEPILKEFLKDENINTIRSVVSDAYEKENFINDEVRYSAVLSSAHTLKGILANLGMDDLNKSCSDIVEKLRANDYDNIDKMIDIFDEKYRKMCNNITEAYYG